jgi:hypothetical protein
MNKIYSKKIALIISNQEIKEMFDLAKIILKIGLKLV